MTTVPSGSVAALPCANRGRARGASRSHHPAALSQLSCAMRPRVTTTRTRASRATSAPRYGRQRSSSARLGLLPGGAQRAAAAIRAQSRAALARDDGAVDGGDRGEHGRKLGGEARGGLPAAQKHAVCSRVFGAVRVPLLTDRRLWWCPPSP